MSRFYVRTRCSVAVGYILLTFLQFGGSDSSGSDDDTSLPYPKPLARSAFLTPDFSPTAFLSSLHNRHQTLEDLRAELRTRSQELNKELLDLVNDNYQDFLSLGTSLKGGDEKIEEVRVGLLGFKRDVDGLKAKVETRRKETGALLERRRSLWNDIRTGRRLLEVDSRLEELEERLMIGANAANHGNGTDGGDLSDFSDSDDSEMESGTLSISRLRSRVEQYIYVRRLATELGAKHPFLVKQEERILRIKQALLLDLGSSLRQGDRTTDSGQARLMKVLALYRDMDEVEEALQVLKELQ